MMSNSWFEVYSIYSLSAQFKLVIAGNVTNGGVSEGMKIILNNEYFVITHVEKSESKTNCYINIFIDYSDDLEKERIKTLLRKNKKIAVCY